MGMEDELARPLAMVVALSESTKQLRRYAFEVGLSALGAIVRSSRAGDQLRGFKEVASQMRGWSAELANLVEALNVRCAQSVRLESDLLRRTRLLTLFEQAAGGSHARQLMAAAHERESCALRGAREQLARSNSGLLELLEQLVQLGMMASVLARAALIEAGSGGEHERNELSIASREFASYAERVNDVALDASRRCKRGNG